MDDKQHAGRTIEELDETALDAVTGGKDAPPPKPPKPATVWKDGNIAGDDDWEKVRV